MLKVTRQIFILLLILSAASFSQIVSTKEENDFHFAMNLFENKNYQLAYEQFKSFTEHYPASLSKPDAEYHAAECLYKQESFTDAIIGFRNFLRMYPNHIFSDDAAFKIGEILYRKQEYAKAVPAYLQVLDDYPESPLASESAYWAGESALKSDNLTVALKYFTVSYENYPAGRLRDYALFSIGYVQEKIKSYADSYESYSRLLKQFPSSSTIADANTHIASVLFLQKDYQKTIDWLTPLSDSPDTDNAAARLYYRAESEYQLGHYTKAEELYNSFLSAYPNNARAREVQYSRGWSLLQQKKYTEAITIFDQLGNGNDAIADASRFRKGVALRFSKEPMKAEEVFQTMLTKNPKGEFTDNALFELGMISFEKKDFERTAPIFERIIQDFPKSDIRADAYNMLGETELSMNNLEKALSAFEQVGQIPTATGEIQSSAFFRQGYVLFQLHKYNEAAQHFDEFIHQYPSDARTIEAWLWKGEAQFQNGDFESAITTYTHVLETTQDDLIKQDALYGIGWSYYKMKNYSDAEKIFVRLTKEYRGGKHDVDANVRLGDILYAMERYPNAAETYRYTSRMYAKNPLAAYALLQLALVDYHVGSVAMGVNTLKSLIQKYPDSKYCDDAQYHIGWMYLQTKDYSVAMSEFEKVLKDYPASALISYALYGEGDAYSRLSKYNEAANMFRKIIEAYPTSPLVPDALNNLSMCLRQLGKQEEASRLSAEFLKRNTTSEVAARILYKNASDAFDKKKFDDAIVLYKNLISQYDSSDVIPQAYLQLARSQYAVNKYEAAQKTLDSLIEKFPNHSSIVDAKIFSASISVEAQQYEDAIRILTDILKLKSASDRKDEILFQRGNVYKIMHNLKQARKDYEASMHLNTASNYALRSKMNIAILDAQSGQVDSALISLRSISSSRTDEIGAEAQFNIGQIFIDQKKYPDAIQEFQKVESGFPKSNEFCAKSILSIGVCYQLQGSSSKAKAAYKKVIDTYSGTDAATEAAYRLNRLD